MALAVERIVELAEVQAAILTLWDTPDPINYKDTYQRYCLGEAVPIITAFTKQQVLRQLGSADTREETNTLVSITEAGADITLRHQLSPDITVDRLADAWISHSTLTISWLSEGKPWLMVARLAQYPGFCGLEELQIRSGGQIKNPLAIANRRELEGRDQRARYLAY